MYDLTTRNQSSGPLSFEQIHDRLSMNINDEAAYHDLATHIKGWIRSDGVHDQVHGGAAVENDTLYRVFIGFRRTRGRETFQGFVRGEYWNARKRAWADKRLVPFDPTVHDRIDDGMPETDEMARECMDWLRKAYPHQFRAIIMKEVEGCDYRTIAATLGIAEGNARQSVSRGKLALRECVSVKRNNEY
ncbi:MAG: sigma-70 family RNA polymerase sigma factor [Chloroflexi bacterium]|nr:sigma-70 family RNA polymerase sigma factor [Chloroflexota bacterium]